MNHQNSTYLMKKKRENSFRRQFFRKRMKEKRCTNQDYHENLNLSNHRVSYDFNDT